MVLLPSNSKIQEKSGNVSCFLGVPISLPTSGVSQNRKGLRIWEGWLGGSFPAYKAISCKNYAWHLKVNLLIFNKRT